MPLSLAFPIVAILHSSTPERVPLTQESGKVQQGLNLRVVLAIYAVSVVMYLLAYYLWRQKFSSQYGGNVADGLDVSRSLRVLWTYTLGASPFSMSNISSVTSNPNAILGTLIQGSWVCPDFG